MAAALGLAFDPPPLPDPAGEAGPDDLHAYVLDRLSDAVLPHVDDRLAQARVKDVARVVKHLDARARHGAAFDAAELDDLAALLGARPATVATGRAAVDAAARTGAVGAEAYLRYRARRAARENELLRAASGVLADRHWPPLR